MIKLNVEEYCHNCPRFEASVESVNYDVHGFDPNEITVGIITSRYDHTITCENRDQCRALYKHIESSMKNRV